jgi:2-oxo-4-hydroxy-4-carboxy-5-ureidoimidazoline decarboxylase
LIEGDRFTARFGHLFEHSLWVVERAAAKAPFADAAALHAALMAVVAQASEADQLALIRAHPELAAKSVPLTQASESEQKGAGLKALSEDEFARFARLNAAYGAKFGFPFIICVRMHGKNGIFAAFEQRLGNDADVERAQALREIGYITRLRLDDLLGVAP